MSNKRRKKNNDPKIFVLIGFLMVLACCAGVYHDSVIMPKYDAVPAVITQVGKGRKKNVAYVEYTYNNEQYKKALNYYNAFTMKKGKEITVYIDPKHPDLPYVPAKGIYILLGAIGFWIFASGLTIMRKGNKEG